MLWLERERERERERKSKRERDCSSAITNCEKKIISGVLCFATYYTQYTSINAYHTTQYT